MCTIITTKADEGRGKVVFYTLLLQFMIRVLALYRMPHHLAAFTKVFSSELALNLIPDWKRQPLSVKVAYKFHLTCLGEERDEPLRWDITLVLEKAWHEQGKVGKVGVHRLGHGHEPAFAAVAMRLLD